MNLLCAVCLNEQIDAMDFARNPEDAITITNGQAVCRRHFAAIRRKVNNVGGAVALAMLTRPGMDAL